MSVTSLDFQNTYTTDGVTATYPFTWTCVNANEVTAYLNNVAQTIGTDFTVALNPTGIGGTITFVSVPVTSLDLLIQRVDDFLQPNNFGNNQAIPPQTLVQMFDKLTIMCQQLLAQTNLSLALSLPSAALGVSGVLPSPIVPGALIGWDAAGTAPYYCVPHTAGWVITDNGPGQQFSSQPATGGGGGGGNVVGPTPPVVAGSIATWADTSGRVLAAGAASSALRSSLISVAGRQLPATGTLSGTYWHFGPWVQSGALNALPGVKVFMNNGAPGGGTPATFLSGSPIAVGTDLPGGLVSTNAGPGQDGHGIGGASYGATVTLSGGGGGGFGGVGGNGACGTGSCNIGGCGYNWRSQFSGSSGQAGSGIFTDCTAGGNGGGAIYWECTGDVSFNTAGGGSSAINANGGNAANALNASGSGGSGGAIVMRVGGSVIEYGTGDALQALGGNGGNGADTGGGGGGGGWVDVIAGGAITGVGAITTGGNPGSGGSTIAQAGANGQTILDAGGFPVSEF